MTQTVIPQTGAADPARPLTSTRPVLSLHGSRAGIPTTWHVTPLADEPDAGYLIECAEGDIHSPAVWMQARRDARVVSEAEVLELVRAVLLT